MFKHHIRVSYEWAIEGTRRALKGREIAFEERDYSYGGVYGGTSGVWFDIADGSKICIEQFTHGRRSDTFMGIEHMPWWDSWRIVRKLANDLRLTEPPQEKPKRKDGLWKLLRD